MNYFLPVLGVVLIGPVAFSAPIPKPAPVPLYYPTTVGDKWVNEGESASTTSEVVAVEKMDWGLVVTVESATRSGGDVQKRKTLTAVSDDGVEWLDPVAGKKADPSMWHVKLPIRPGERWTEPARSPTNKRDTRKTTGKPKEITVKAGTFTAVPMTYESIEPDQKVHFTITAWYAPNVGLIRTSMASDLGEELVSEMVSFTPGKK